MERMKIEKFTDLDAWKEGHQLVLGIYKATESFPNSEMYGLISQMRRSAVSITSNVAEGFKRISGKEKVQFYSIAQGSLTELQNQLIIAKDVGYIREERFQALEGKSIKVQKIISGLVRYSRKNI